MVDSDNEFFGPTDDPSPAIDNNPAVLSDDIRWVYANLGKELHHTDCPSRGANELLKLANKDQRWFLERMLPKLIPSKAEQAAQDVDRDDDARQADLLSAARKIVESAAGVYGG